MRERKPQRAADDYRTPDSAGPMQRKHDSFVAFHAERLGVTEPEILASVRTFGLTAEDIAAAEDASTLTRYPKGNGPAFKVVGFQPVSDTRTLPCATSGRERYARRAEAARAKGAKPRFGPRARNERWNGSSSMADAIRKAGLRK